MVGNDCVSSVFFNTVVLCSVGKIFCHENEGCPLLFRRASYIYLPLRPEVFVPTYSSPLCSSLFLVSQSYIAGAPVLASLLIFKVYSDV